MNRVMALLLLLLVLLGEGTARAQDEEKVAPLLESYWGTEVEVVQPRKVETARTVEIVGLVGVIPNDAFLVYVPVGVRVAYHVGARWALEASTEYNLSVDTGLRSYLEQSDAELRARIRDRQQVRINAGALWSPVYGKVAMGRRVVRFDGYLMGGAGIVRTGEEKTVDLAAAVRPDFHLGAGLRVFLGGRFVARLEYRQYMFLRPQDNLGRGGGVGFPSEIALCAGLLLGGRR
jgi:outer membrane beta-barrel protein